MSDKSDSLGTFLREVSNWQWSDFCKAENDPNYTNNQATIFALVRACAMQKMDAIKLALNRIDGKLKTPIRIEMPKVFYLFPNAALPEAEAEEAVLPDPLRIEEFTDPITKELMTFEVLETEPPEEREQEELDLPSLSLRQTVAKMADAPRQVPATVIEFATKVQQWLNGRGPQPMENPLVKSVVAAHLLAMAQNRNLSALTEVFDQIDGKLVETIQVLGEDIFITSYSLQAPDGAYLNSDGVLQLEAKQAQEMWAQKLGTK
jgi:hypothetical protein